MDWELRDWRLGDATAKPKSIRGLPVGLFGLGGEFLFVGRVGEMNGTPRLELVRDAKTVVGLVDTVTGKSAKQETEVELVWDGEFLHVRFVCQDEFIWGTMSERDEPIFEEEVVEVFLAPGAADPTMYFEFEVSPNGVLWDGWISSPNLSREGMEGHPEWDCPELQWGASRHDGDRLWEGWFSIPLGVLWGFYCSETECSGPLPSDWRINFYRIDRPEGEAAETTAWSPTLETPANFHVPPRMGSLVLIPGSS